jgi:hypothetical protein
MGVETTLVGISKAFAIPAAPLVREEEVVVVVPATP